MPKAAGDDSLHPLAPRQWGEGKGEGLKKKAFKIFFL
jgi:hypothetical protein